MEEVEKKQKEKAKKRSEEKKKKKIRGVGLKGGERMVEVAVSDEDLKKQEQAKETIQKGETGKKKKVKKKLKQAPGKNYKKASKLSPKKAVSVKEAVSLLRKMHYAKFEESFELHLNLLKPGLKGEAELPFGTGEKIKVMIANEKVLKKIEEGSIDFDVLIAHPSFMPQLAKYARVLGPKGLMPNPKKGTISVNPEEAAKKFTDKLVQWKTESKFPLIHQAVGKFSFKDEEIMANVNSFLSSVGSKNIKSAYIKLTMTPAIEVDLKSLQ